jgi:beta-1,4-N-acetylglucosaminyltransferase
MLTSAAFLTALLLSITALIILTIHILSLLPPRRPLPAQRNRPTEPDGHILIVLGSGGHTAEMTLLLQDNDAKILKTFEERTWIVSEGDGFSGSKAAELEKRVEKGKGEVVVVPRARRVHQSLLTTPIDCLKCLWACVTLLRARSAPDIILTNGPGTGVILIFASLLQRFLSPFFAFGNGHEGTRIIYVESLARVKKLSLSGRILKRVVDRFVVQWDGLGDEFAGNLVLDAARRVGAGKGEAGKQIKAEEGGRVKIEI